MEAQDNATTMVKVETETVNDKETTIKIELDSALIELQLQVTNVEESVENQMRNTENVFDNVQIAIKEEINFPVEQNHGLTEKSVAENLLVEKESSEATIENQLIPQIQLRPDVKQEGVDGECYDELGFDDGSIDSNEAAALGQVEACLQDYEDCANGGITTGEHLQDVVIKKESSVLPDAAVSNEITSDVHGHSASKYSFTTKIPADMVDSIVNGTFDAESDVPNGKNRVNRDIKMDTESLITPQNNSLLEVSKETECNLDNFQLNSITGDILSLEQEAYTAYALQKQDLVSCPKCPKICNQSNFQRHLKVHETIKNYENGRKRGQMTRKLKQLNQYVKISQYRCHLCPKTCSNKSGVIGHIRTAHKFVENVHEVVEAYNGINQNIVIPNQGIEKPESQQNLCDSDELDNSQSKLQEGYKCTCGKVFKRRSRMETCLRSHETSESNQYHIKCMTCSKQFQNKDELASHRKRLHRKRFPCKFCPLGFNSRRKLLKHLQIHQKVHLTEYKVIEEIVKGKQKLVCFICLKPCQELSVLKTHVVTDHKEPYQCRHCNNNFPKILDFCNHLRVYHPEVEGQSILDVLEAFSRLIQEWKCKECDLQFLEPDKLALHEIEQHSPESKSDAQFQCTDCRRVFVTQKGLTSHRRIHEETVEKPNIDEMGVMCLECRMMCKDMHALTSHMRFHSQDRKYACKYCDFRFATIEKRRAHVEIHTGDMKFVCFICEYQCTSLNRLKKHKESLKHANMKEYLLTGKPLIEESTSNVKEKKVSSAKKRKKSKSEKDSDSDSSSSQSVEVSCDICGEKFSSESEMLEHKQTHPFIEFPNEDKPSRIFFK